MFENGTDTMIFVDKNEILGKYNNDENYLSVELFSETHFFNLRFPSGLYNAKYINDNSMKVS